MKKIPTYFAIAAILTIGAAHADDDDNQGRGRDFPEGLLLDDPDVEDVLQVPSFSSLGHGADTENDLNLGIEKRLTDNIGLEVSDGYTLLRGNPHATGWQNLSFDLKYVGIEDDSHEFMASFDVEREFGGTGAERVGADDDGDTTPAVNLGKGMGNSDIRWLKPMAVTLNLAEQISDAGSRHEPWLGTVGASLQYDLAYLQPEGNESGRAHLAGRFTPMIEVLYTAPTGPSTGNDPTATLGPGVIYETDTMQVAVEGLLPLTRATGQHLGGMVQLNWFFSGALGKPIFQ